MQKKTLYATAIAAVCTLLISCDGNDSKTFATKTDSVAFARAVMEQYPDAGSGRIADTSFAPVALQGSDSGFSPISWETVEDYSKRYDAAPGLKAPEGYFYQGFSVDTAGYNLLLRSPLIKGIYLRLGQKPDASYTIMVLGLDRNGKIINSGSGLRSPKDSTNFDNVGPCPSDCPE